MTTTLKFEIEWLGPFDESSPEGMTFAAVKLLLGGQPATEVEDLVAQTTRNEVFVSAYPLARFLAENWWRLRWEPAPARANAAWRLRHCLSAVGDGYIWPDLSFASDGESIYVEAKGNRPSTTAQIRYIANLDGWISAEQFEQSVDQLLEMLEGRVRAMSHRDSALSGLIRELEFERSDTDVSRWRRLEAMAGYDPDEAPESFVRDLLGEIDAVGWSSLQELPASSRDHAVQDLAILREELAQHGTRFQVAELNQLRDAVAADVADLNRPPWVRASQAAYSARRHLGLNGEVVSNRRLAEIFDFPEHTLETGERSEAPFSASLDARDNGQSRLILNKRLGHSRRFAVCRLLGDQLSPAGEDDRLSTVTEARTARQKFQRAFAQELLCPFEALREVLGSDSPSHDDMDSAAEHFQVSSLLVRTTLVNRDVIPRDVLDCAG